MCSLGVTVRVLELGIEKIHTAIRVMVSSWVKVRFRVNVTHVILSRSSIIWYQSRGSALRGNPRSGVALAICFMSQPTIHLRAQGLGKEMSTPPALLI